MAEKAEFFFKRICQDLLKLEINTIIKNDMSGVKMPNSRRHALYSLAGEYSAMLEEYEVREPIYWKYGGMRSYGELRDRAKNGIIKFKDDLKILPPDKQQNIREKITMLERIQYQSSQIVGLFKILEHKYRDNIKKNEDGYSQPPLKKKDLQEIDKIPPSPHLASRMWNNDIDTETMNEIDDLDLTPDLVILIRKAWEIGTETIVLQTFIQLDGDVTTRISESLVKTPNETLFKIHNESIGISTKFWYSLVSTLGEMLKGISGIFSGK